MKFKDYCKKYLLSALFVIVAPLYLLIWIFLIPAIIMILLYSTVFIGPCLIIKLAEVFESEW